MNCSNGKCPPPKKNVSYFGDVPFYQVFPDLFVKTGKDIWNGSDVSSKSKTKHYHSYILNNTVYFQIVANGGQVLTVDNINSQILNTTQKTAIFALFGENPVMNNTNGYNFDLQSVLLYLSDEGFFTEVSSINIQFKFKYLGSQGKKLCKVDKPIYEPVTGSIVESIWLNTENWLETNGQTVKVQDQPLLWIKGNYVDTFTANSFDLQNQARSYQYAGNDTNYNNTFTIELNDKNLTTEFNNDLLSKFPRLSRLNIDNNNVPALDITSLVNLEALFAESNNINVLDPSNCLELINLRVGNNSISDLDVTNLNLLQFLFFNDNNISNIDLSNCKLLQDIKGFNNDLSGSINLSDFDDLENVELYNNSITSINLTGSNQISLLSIQQNNLTSINLTGLVNIESLRIQENNLTSLDVSDLTSVNLINALNNDIEQLDVSSNVSLTELRIQNNLLDGDANSDVLNDLVNNNLNNGYFQSTISSGSLTAQGVIDKDILNSNPRNWTIVGI